jgi:sugar (pentulose or hexulose) kinase
LSATSRAAYLGVDIGTSGCRAMAIDAAGQTLAETSVDLPRAVQSDDGRVEQDPKIWWRALITVLRRLAARLPRDTQPEALSLDGTSGSVLLIDRAGRPLGPGVRYDDRRGLAHLAHIAERAPETAAVHGAGSSLPKVLALLAERTPPFGSRVLHQSEWLSGGLIGDYRRGDENNCLKLGYDAVRRRWPDWIGGLLPVSFLPEVVPVGSRLGGLSATAALDTGLPRGLAVIAGTTDSNAASLAAGALEIGDAVTSLGSTLVLKLVSAAPLFSPTYGVYSHRLFDRWLVGGASNSGGRVLRHFFTDRQMSHLTPRISPGRPTGLDYYPLLERGERFPYNDPYLEPRIEPIPDDPARLFQALLEGIGRIEQAGYERLAELGAGRPKQIFTGGGGAGNPAWREIREHLMKIPIRSARHDQAAYGAALIARQGAG